MTHPDTLQIPRAVVEQALEAMAPFAGDASGIHKDWADERRRASLTQDKPLTVAHFRVLLKASEALRAALQPQATPSKLYRLMRKDGAAWLPASEWMTEVDARWVKLTHDKPDEWRINEPLDGKKVADAFAKALQAQAAEPTTFLKERSQLEQEWSTLRHMQEQYKAALARRAAAEPVDEWKEAVLDAVAAYSMDFRMDVPPCVIVNQLIGMAVTMAKDPAINKEAATYSTEAEGDAYTHGFFDGLREPLPPQPATQAENPLLKDYVEKAVAAERRKWQAALTAALEKFNEIVSMEGTESNEWDGVERVIPEICAVAKAAIAQIEALGVKHD